MTDRIESALAALPKATPGPWMADGVGVKAQGNRIVCVGFFYSKPEEAANRALCAAAPDLAAEVLRLRAEVAALTRKLEFYQRSGESISQALNEGKGVYKP